MSYNDPGVRRLFVWLVVSLAVLIGLGRLPAFFPPAAAQDAAKGPATAATAPGSSRARRRTATIRPPRAKPRSRRGRRCRRWTR